MNTHTYTMNRSVLTAFILFFCISLPFLVAQKPYKLGTTAVPIFEIGFGTAGNAMGDARVASTSGIESILWNPAGIALTEGHEFLVLNQPWLIDINTGFAGVVVDIPQVGKLGLSMVYADYGEMEVTTMNQQNGTGEIFTANDYVMALSFARKLADWFSLGVNLEYFSSSIYHETANAVAADLGVIVKTDFFSSTGDRQEGLAIGMSINNYGAPMKYEGKDLMIPVDILDDEDGNYGNVPGRIDLAEWELPLYFRIGASISPIVTQNSRMMLEVDAVHPNNNSEYINLGGEYSFTQSNFGTFFLRTGYKGIFMEDSEYGITAGAGVKIFMMGNRNIQIEYSYRDVGALGISHSYSIQYGF